MATRNKSGSGDVATILVVDDHDENILALEAMLARPDIEIVTARSGAEALRLVLKYDFAVILLDVLMPTMDGFETARLMRTREASRHTPIIFLTAAGSDIDMVYRGYSVGAVDYLVKPLNPDIVKAKVAVFVELFRKTRQLHRHQEALRTAERERSAAALKESDSLYEASFNAAAVGIAHTDAHGRWLRANPRFCQIVGRSHEQTLQLRLQDITHPEDLAEEAHGYARLVSGEIATHRRETRYLHSSGRTVWVDATVSLAYDAAGKPKHFVVVVEDITERRRAEERQELLTAASQILLRSLDRGNGVEEVAALVARSVGDWCLIATKSPSDDPPFEISLAHRDPKLAPLASSCGKALVDNPVFRQLLTADRVESWEDMTSHVAAAWNLDREVWDMLRALGCGPATIVPLTVREQVVGQVLVAAGEGAGPFSPSDVVTVRDLAQRISLGVENARLYREAREAIRVRDEFLSIASHELRTPLTPLQIHFERLLHTKQRDENLWAPDRLQRTLQRCERQVHRLEALIDNLLDVSRISSGRLRLQPETVDLAELVRDVSGRLAEELTAAGCELVLKTDAEVVGQWDRLRIEQVVTNILGNAIKYGGGKPIEISVEMTVDGGRFSVQDHGIGIREQDQRRIFRRFQRAVSSKSYGGLGLGLYITRQIVDAHNGSIEVKSEAGAGSEFIVELPRVLITQPVDGMGVSDSAPIIYGGTS